MPLSLQKLLGRPETSSVQLWVSYNRQPMKAAQFMTRHPITVSLPGPAGPLPAAPVELGAPHRGAPYWGDIRRLSEDELINKAPCLLMKSQLIEGITMERMKS